MELRQAVGNQKPQLLCQRNKVNKPTENVTNTVKESKLVQPKVQVKVEEPETTPRSNIPSVSKPSYYTQSLYNQSKKYKTNQGGKVFGDTGSVENAQKKPTKVSQVNHATKGVKLAKFDLLESKDMNSRTRTPKKVGIKNVFGSPTKDRSNLKQKPIQSATKEKLVESKPKPEPFARTMNPKRPATAITKTVKINKLEESKAKPVSKPLAKPVSKVQKTTVKESSKGPVKSM